MCIRDSCTCTKVVGTSHVKDMTDILEMISSTEKILMDRFKHIVIQGKRNLGVPVLFSADFQVIYNFYYKFVLPLFQVITLICLRIRHPVLHCVAKKLFKNMPRNMKLKTHKLTFALDSENI